MTNESGDNRLDQFLDGVMSQQEAADFLEHANHEEVEEAKELQSRIDESLRRMMSGMIVDEAQVREQFLAAEESKTEPTVQRSVEPVQADRRSWIQLAIAASLLFAVGLGIWFNSGTQGVVEPVFAVRPLTQIYAEKVASGFRPYYVCEDDQRFAETFQAKLGIALALAPMPDSQRMLGLSYLGGMSRDGVAMLSEVDGKPVIVFVDRDNAPGIEEAVKSVDAELNVFVERKFGLVFAEVTPLDSAGLIEYFKTADAGGVVSEDNSSVQ